MFLLILAIQELKGFAESPIATSPLLSAPHIQLMGLKIETIKLTTAAKLNGSMSSFIVFHHKSCLDPTLTDRKFDEGVNED